jgi:low affinity Fe/Cu permease
MQRFFSDIASRTAIWMGHPSAFVGATLACIVWAVTGPLFNYSDTWQLVINTATTVLTFLAVFLIQNSQNRDGAAIQAKLDELLRAVDKARTQFIGIEHLTESQIELVRRALERHAQQEKEKLAEKKGKSEGQAGARDKSAEDTVDRLLDRF